MSSADPGATLYVKIHLDVLRRHLSAADHQRYTTVDIQEWLLAAGFKRWGDFWAVHECHLGQLDPTEVSELFADLPPMDVLPTPGPEPTCDGRLAPPAF